MPMPLKGLTETDGRGSIRAILGDELPLLHHFAALLKLRIDHNPRRAAREVLEKYAQWCRLSRDNCLVHFTCADPLDHTLISAAVGARIPSLLPLSHHHLKPFAHSREVIVTQARGLLHQVSGSLVFAFVEHLLNVGLLLGFSNILVVWIRGYRVIGLFVVFGCFFVAFHLL